MEHDTRFNVRFFPTSLSKKYFKNISSHSSTTVRITLPDGFTCDHCVLQLLRQAGEWTFPGGYVFWTCSDIAIQDGDSMYIYKL